jgi:predicted cupin superfamily sugar epimerase
MTADEIKRLLGLVPLAGEGGFFTETYRSREGLAAGALPGLRAPRSLATAIYYLLEAGQCSRLHRLPADELFHFYLGDAVEMLQLGPGGGARVVTLGPDLAAGMVPQALVPAGAWQGARLRPGGRWALLGTTMAPGFDFADFEAGPRAELTARWPESRALIEALTPGG